MKFSISMPDPMAQELRHLSKEQERSISWFLQKAWLLARETLLSETEQASSALVKQKKKAMGQLKKLSGSLKKDFPKMDSVKLAKQAFSNQTTKS